MQEKGFNESDFTKLEIFLTNENFDSDALIEDVEIPNESIIKNLEIFQKNNQFDNIKQYVNDSKCMYFCFYFYIIYWI